MKKLLILLFLLSSAAAFSAASDSFDSGLELYKQAVQSGNFKRIFDPHETLASQKDKALLKLIADIKPTTAEHRFLSNILNLFQSQSPIYKAVQNQNLEELRNEIDLIEQLNIQAQEANERASTGLIEKKIEETKTFAEKIKWSPWKIENTLQNKSRAVLAQHPERVLAALSMLHAHGGCSDNRSLLPALCINNALIRRIGMQKQILINPLEVCSIAFSPDSNMLASVSEDEIIRLWNVHTGSMMGKLQGHTGPIYSVAFSPDGRTLASASCDSTVRLWNVHTGNELNILQGHITAVASVAFSPDGSTLASSGADDNTIRLWNVDTRCETLVLQYAEPVALVTFSPDGSTLAFASGDTVRLWNVHTGHETSILHGNTNWLFPVAFSPDGNTLAFGSYGNSVRLWNVHTGREMSILQGDISSVAFSPDGSTLASGSHDGTVCLWNTQTGLATSTLRGHTDPVSQAAFSPDGNTLASGSFDHTIVLWKQYTQQLCTIINQSEQAFLLNAIRDWDENKPHIVAPENRAICKSLIERFAFLNNPKLFKTT